MLALRTCILHAKRRRRPRYNLEVTIQRIPQVAFRLFGRTHLCRTILSNIFEN